MHFWLLIDTHYPPKHNSITITNIWLTSPSIYAISCFSSNTCIFSIAGIYGILFDRKIVYIPLKSKVFYFVKSFEIFPKRNDYFCSFRVICFELMLFFTVSIEKTVDCIVVYKKIFLSVVTDINYSTFTKIYDFFLLSASTDKLLSTP